MKIVVTADIHFGVGNNQHIVKNLAKRIIKTNADVLILAGDTFHFKQQHLIDCLKLFDTFKGDKLFVPGNHDLWTNSSDSLVFCGHTHQKKKAIFNGITAINIGSDYLRKRFETIET